MARIRDRGERTEAADRGHARDRRPDRQRPEPGNGAIPGGWCRSIGCVHGPSLEAGTFHPDYDGWRQSGADRSLPRPAESVANQRSQHDNRPGNQEADEDQGLAEGHGNHDGFAAGQVGEGQGDGTSGTGS